MEAMQPVAGHSSKLVTVTAAIRRCGAPCHRHRHRHRRQRRQRRRWRRSLALGGVGICLMTGARGRNSRTLLMQANAHDMKNK